MATERMYDLALQFKATKLWRQVFDSELFAVQLTDGEIGYCCVMGALGEHLALAVYEGDVGYQSLCELRRRFYEPALGVRTEVITAMQNCLQCSFENRDLLSPQELDEARAYARSHGRSFRGRNAFPKFTKYRPGYFPWHFDSELDERRICEALRAAIEMSALLGSHEKEELGLRSLDEGIEEIPLLSFQDGKWKLARAKLPSGEMSHPEPAFVNEILATRIRRKKKRGSLQCGTMRGPAPLQQELGSDEVPFYPLVLFCVDSDTGLMLQPIMTDGKDPEEMMNGFAEVLAQIDTAPRTILCGDDRCLSLLRDLCAKTGIQLKREDGLDELRDAMEGFTEHMMDTDAQDDDFAEMLDTLEGMPDEVLMGVPRMIRESLIDLADAGELPEKLAARVRRLLC